MNDDQLIEVLRTSGKVTDEQIFRWRDAAQLMAALDAIGRDGVNALVNRNLVNCSFDKMGAIYQFYCVMQLNFINP